MARSGPIRLLCFTVACWLRFLSGRDEQGREMPMQDPLAPRLKAIAQAAGADPLSLLSLRAIFSEDLASSPAFVVQVRVFLQSLYRRGARATLMDAVER
jgi:mannitol 2-dehydrogenase